MFFKSVFIKEWNCPPDFDLDVKSTEHVSFLIDKIIQKLDNLTPYESPRVDKLHLKILRQLSNELSLPSSLIFSKSFSEGKPPQDW